MNKLIKISNNFTLDEFLPPELYNMFGDAGQRFVPVALIQLAEFFRKRHGVIIINNYLIGGQYSESGIRMHNSTTGAKYSMHKYCMALDLKFTLSTPEEVRKDICDNQSLYQEAGLTAIEDGIYCPTWVHVSTQNTGSNHIVILKP